MGCSEYEQSIYLWNEISPAEKEMVNKHLDTCTDCAALFKQVQLVQKQVAEVSLNKTIAPHAAQLTSRVMQAVHNQQKNSLVNRASRLLSPFQLIRYSFAALSLALLISFGLEYIQTGSGQKTQSVKPEESVVLSSAIIRSSIENRKKRKSIFSTCKTPFTDQLAYRECIKQQLQ